MKTVFGNHPKWKSVIIIQLAALVLTGCIISVGEYQNSAYGFKINFPIGWLKYQKNNDGIYYTSWEKDQHGAPAATIGISFFISGNFEEEHNALVDNLTKEGYYKILNQGDTAIDGYDGKWVLFHWDGTQTGAEGGTFTPHEKLDVHSLNYFVSNGHAFVMISIASPSSIFFDKYKPVFEKVLSSFEFM